MGLVAPSTRWQESNGVFGYYDNIPSVTINGFATISRNSGLNNTLIVSRAVVPGTGPLPSVVAQYLFDNKEELFDINLVFSQAYRAQFGPFADILASMQVSVNGFSLRLGDDTISYQFDQLNELEDDLIIFGIPAPLASGLRTAIEDAYNGIGEAQDNFTDHLSEFVTDTLDSSDVEQIVNIDLVSETVTVGDDGTPLEFDGIVNAVGTVFSDFLTGNDVANRLEGGAGEDQINGGGGNDELYGGSGADTIDSGEGSDVVEGGADGDTITGGYGGSDRLLGQSGNDTIRIVDGGVAGAADASSAAYGGSGNDVLDARGSGGEHSLSGGSGNDTLYGNGNSTLSGGSGADTFYVQQGDVILDGEAGDTLIFNGVAISGNDFATNLDLIEYWGTSYVGDDWYHTYTGLGVDGPKDFAVIFTNLNTEAGAQDLEHQETFSGLSFDIIIIADPDTTIYPGDLDWENIDYFEIKNFNPGDFGIATENPAWEFVEFFEPPDGGGIVRPFPLLNPWYDEAGDPEHAGELDYGTNLTISDRELVEEEIFEQITEVTSGNPDAFQGTDQNETVNLGGQPGRALGGGGDDTITGSIAGDYIFGETGDDVIDGGAGDDMLFGGSFSNAVLAGFGDAPTSGFYDDGGDTIRGGDGNDFIDGGGYDDVLYGDGGDDVIYGGDDDDYIYGGTGNDQLFAGDGYDRIWGGDGEDFIDLETSVAGGYADGGSGADTIVGTDSRDRINGGSGNDTIRAGGGDDEINGGTGDDLLDGGGGTDIFYYSFGDGNDYIQGSDLQGSKLVFLDVASDQAEIRFINKEVIITLSDGAVITVRSSFSKYANIDYVDFADGVTLNVRDLDYEIHGTDDDDVLNTADFGLHYEDSLVFGFDGNDTITGANDNDDMFDGGDGNDVLNGAGGNDMLYGGSGNDIVDGGSGDDAHFGGAGDDLIRGNGGIDSFDGGEGIDTIDMSYSSDATTIDLDGETITFTGGTVETVVNVENAIGGSGANTLIGSDLDNVLEGLGGSDTIAGGAGGDLIIGGTGNDVLSGQSGADVFQFASGDGNDTITDFNITEDTVELNGTRLNPNDPKAGISVAQAGANVIVSYGSGDTLTLEDVDLIEWQNAPPPDTGPVDENLSPLAAADAATVTEDGTVLVDVLSNDSDPDGDPLMITGVAGGVNGTASVVDGQIHYVPNANFNGTETLTYTIDDGQGGVADATVTVTVTPESDAPTIIDDTATMDEDGTILIDVLANDTDIDGDALVLVSATGATNGTVSVEAGQLRYVPDPGFAGDETITYEISDGSGETASGTVVVTVLEANEAPVAVADTAFVDEDNSVLIDVIANDTDNNGDNLTIVSVDAAANGTVVIEGNQLRYTPDSNFNGTDAVTYTVADGRGGTSSTTLDITVSPVNDTPITVSDTAVVAEDTEILIDVFSNDIDADGDALSVVSIDSATNGSAVIEGNQIRFTPDENFNGPATITYTMSDGQGGVGSSFVDIDVTPVNDAPIAVNDAVTVDSGETILIDAIANDSDPDGDQIYISNVGWSGGGTVSFVNGQLQYEAVDNFSSDVVITYTLNDGEAQSTGTVNVTVIPTNTGPIANSDTASLTTDQTVLIDVLANDTDADGDTLTITAVDPATNGTVTIEDGQLRYVPNTGFTGDETLSYTISDGRGGSATASVQVSVTAIAPPNSAPITIDDSATVDQEATVLIDVLNNDSDPDGDVLTIASVTASANGSAVIEDGAIRYTPNAGFSGADTISYTVSDGAGGTATASVQVDVAAVQPGAPIVVDDFVTVVSGGTILIDAIANDSDPDGDGIYISNVSPTIAQSLQFVDGKILYEALDNYTGVVEMVYTVSDFGGATSTGSVFIDVVAANTGPIANDDTASVDENGSVLIDVLANDDAGGGTLTITSVTPSANGSAVIENGAIRYVPNVGFSGPDTITYEVSDGAGGTATASVQVEVAVVQAGAPIVVDDFVTVVSGGTILIDAIANDSHPDGVGIYISNVAPTIAQSLQFVDGQIQYEALDNYTGVVEMVYTVTDYGGVSSTGSVFIDVVAPAAAASQASQMLSQNVAPDAFGDTPTAPLGEAIMVDAKASDASLDVASFVSACFAGAPTETPVMSGDSIKQQSEASIVPVMDDGLNDTTDSFVFARDLFKETVNSYRSSGCFDAIDVGAVGLLAAISEGQDGDRGSWMSGGCSANNRLAEASDRSWRDAFDESAGPAIEQVTTDVFEWLM